MPPAREEPRLRRLARSGIGLLRVPLVLAALPQLGCSPRLPPQSDPSRVLEWALGPQNLASPTSPDVFLVLIPPEKLAPKPAPSPPKPPRPATKLSADDEPAPPDGLSECMRATSVLPAPQNDGRIFLAVDGAVHALRPPEKTTTLFEGMVDDVYVNALLAVRKVPEGLELLASVQVKGRAEPQIHALVVDPTRIVRAGLAKLVFKDRSEFFATYTVPRCSPDGKECLGISRDDETSYLEQWSATAGAGSTPMTLAEVEGARDAVWAPSNDGAVYVLERCP